jgi:ATP-binding protein involved in chromosome partitioning
LGIQPEKFQPKDKPMSESLTKERVLDALRPVEDPELHKSLVELGMIKDVLIQDGSVTVEVTLTTPACPLKSKIKEDCVAAVSALPGVKNVEIKFGAQVRQAQPHVDHKPIEGVKNIIAVASGKGGVGKSTVSVNLALSLAKAGAQVGLLDADIYGPNIPIMLGFKDEEPKVEGEILIPFEKQGLKVVSIGLLVPPERALIWRGPMVHSALQQFLRQVKWAPLDYLVIDLPPGTGDAQLTMTQQAPVSGAVIVTTPQQVALADVWKGIQMFRQVNVPILGIVENMSYFVCPGCGEKTEIFGSGGGEKSAKEFGAPFIGKIPIDPRLRQGGDTGKPVVVEYPDSETARIFEQVAGQVAARLSVVTMS